MNSVHDMGGMEGLGQLEIERDEPVFHERWEARVLAINLALGAWRKWNIDAFRHSNERVPAQDYLRISYYERWFTALNSRLLIDGELVTREELESGKPAPEVARLTPPLNAEQAVELQRRGTSFTREVQDEPHFSVGQRIRARNIHPHGHTRLPRYARGRLGAIERIHGAFVFPDANAHFQGEQPQYLYSVRFEAHELWGEAADGRGAVYVDMWESYLEPV